MASTPWSKGKKLVHIDFKGAPPRVDYLHKLIEFFSRLGVDGLLMEYEDMFPYKGQLQILQTTAQPTYREEEILSIQQFAKSKGIEVIPLVQTFGHMEFVLKHKPMWHLREIPHCVGTLNPHKEEGFKLVMEMINQVVELHPGLQTLHIGGDEVYMLGEGDDSKLWLDYPGNTVEKLFLMHITKVAKAVKMAWPHMTVIMWDDMMRCMSLDMIKGCGLVGFVQPMLWDYTPDMDVEKNVSLLEKYCSAGMSDLWAASSFKGSTAVYTSVTSTQRHVDNHLRWLKVAASISSRINLKGIAITGWQRYDHLSVLCELMPVALPSLAACLQTLIYGHFGTEVKKKVADIMGITSMEVQTMQRTSMAGSFFPGRKLAELIVELNLMLNSDDLRFFGNNMFVRGWFSPYHRQRRMVTPLIGMQIHSQASMYLTTLQQKVEAVREEMTHLYPASTAQEWIEQHVQPVVAPLKQIIEDIQTSMMEIVP